MSDTHTRPMPRTTRINRSLNITAEGYAMQLTTPTDPAMAVSTAINTLRKETHPFPPSREGDAESVEFLFMVFIRLFFAVCK